MLRARVAAGDGAHRQGLFAEPGFLRLRDVADPASTATVMADARALPPGRAQSAAPEQSPWSGPSDRVFDRACDLLGRLDHGVVQP